MLCGDLAVMQASGFDSLSFDPFSLFQDGLSPSEVDIGRGQIIDALVIAVVVVVIHEGFNSGPHRLFSVPTPDWQDSGQRLIRDNIERLSWSPPMQL